MFDVIVRGGRVVDPTQDLDAITDVGIRGPRIAAIGTDLIKQGVRGEVVDARGLLVTPGWIDLHTECTGALHRSEWRLMCTVCVEASRRRSTPGRRAHRPSRASNAT